MSENFEPRLAKVEQELKLIKQALVLIRDTMKLNSDRLENIENWLIKFKDTESKKSK